MWDMMSPLELDRCTVSWGKMMVSSNSFRSSTQPRMPVSPPVYVVLGHDTSDGQWHEIVQTSVRSDQIHPSVMTNVNLLKLVVVGEEGVRLTSIISVDSQHCDYQHKFRPVVIDTIKEVEQLVTVSIAWEADSGSDLFAVRWQEYPLVTSVMATLTVNTPAAQITLKSDTSYILQVENTSTGELSEPIIVDTHTTDSISGLAQVPTDIIIIAIVLVSLILVTAVVVPLVRYCRKSDKCKDKKPFNNNVIVDSVKFPLNLDYNNLL